MAQRTPSEQHGPLGRVSPEAGLLLGAGRAILLQLTHPQIGLAIARHSDFATNPMSRLIHTLGYIYALTNGTEAQRQKMVHYVNSAHTPVHGARNQRTGSPAYSAKDPRLQVWVAATLYDSAKVIGEQVLPCWEQQDAEALYSQYARLGDVLQMPTALWPATTGDFARYFQDSCRQLQVTDEIRALARQLFGGANVPWWVRAGLPLLRDITIAQLPANVRELYGYQLTAKVRRRNAAVIRTVRQASRILPRRIRHAPMRAILRHVDQMAASTA